MDTDPEEQLSEEEKAKKDDYLKRLAEKLKDPEFRKIDGFPIGEDDAILALSDPPYFTACPNPFLSELVNLWIEERAQIRKKLNLPYDSINGEYHREPFAVDVSEGKSDPIYRAHSYHTKVPFKAIQRYILNFTQPGDIVLDGFCGTGMTGIAAQLCRDKSAVESLGYVVRDNSIYNSTEVISKLGTRKAILIDLSPAACFIAQNYNIKRNIRQFKNDVNEVIQKTEDELGWMYETWHPCVDHPQKRKAKINYTVLSEVVSCPDCNYEMVFWDVAMNLDTMRVKKEWSCPNCEVKLAKSPTKASTALKVERVFETIFDSTLQTTVKQVKLVPVLINYQLGKDHYEKKPDQYDFKVLDQIKSLPIKPRFPFNQIPEGDKTSDPFNLGITHVHQFYTKRSLLLLSTLLDKISEYADYPTLHLLLFLWQSLMLGYTKMNRYQPIQFGRKGGSQVNRNLNGTLYVPSLISEVSLRYPYKGKVERIWKALHEIELSKEFVAVSTQSSTAINIEDNRIDYIFVDPPFGSNLMYSELNFLWESWLGVITNKKNEAIENKSQNKGLPEYQKLMELCFHEFFRILKPGRWITIEFHNSKNTVWNSIQEALMRSGFIVADVRTFDKQQGTFNQVLASGSVKQDLVISAYKPEEKFTTEFKRIAGTEKAVWDFVRQHLSQLPIAVLKNNIIEIITERQAFLLFDRMVAYHIQRGIAVPLTATEFYSGLGERFPKRDGMYFLPEQVTEYDRTRLNVESIAQLALFISDEKTAIQWLRQQMDPEMGGERQIYQEIQPKFLQQLHQAKHEALPELSEILEQNFLQDAQGKWYVPDSNKASDLEKIRKKALLREFNQYLEGKMKLKQFRTEAVRAGFADAWQRKDFATIVNVAERLPKTIIQEDPDLLMYYDNASLRVD